ncbi:HupE/UreJ family protein [Falsirhodobacter algicola]|uniref:Urease accessory protein n=1 Tax=Falsirhodobacter algicola TaxID=2692330 RepID=A0A8J8SKS3_9RHOB|nr:HupE/UreJ family protein [Falsirhodobacter algicola]QUS35668.1 urease accessory protein [Falsirhodobacter algicola]
MTKLLTLLLILAPSLAAAHPGHDAGSPFMAGLGHPLGGADHVLAMVAVGLWAAALGGRALWAMPLAFVGAMVAGGLLGMAGIASAGTEPMILASVILLGAAAALALRLPLALSVGMIALFGAAHGLAHGAEGPQGHAAFAAGFVLATGALHMAGIVAGRYLAPLARAAGAAAAFGGVLLAMGG